MSRSALNGLLKCPKIAYFALKKKARFLKKCSSKYFLMSFPNLYIWFSLTWMWNRPRTMVYHLSRPIGAQCLTCREQFFNGWDVKNVAPTKVRLFYVKPPVLKTIFCFGDWIQLLTILGIGEIGKCGKWWKRAKNLKKMQGQRFQIPFLIFFSFLANMRAKS